MEPLRILLVDDEPLVAEITSLHLQSMGHDVRSFEKPAEALEQLRSDPSAFELLLTDYAMPGMTGLDLAKRATELRPDLTIVFMTGFSEALVDRLHELERTAAVVHKPFRKKDLEQAIASALEDGGAS